LIKKLILIRNFFKSWWVSSI